MSPKSMARPMSLSQAQLCQILEYEADSGLLRWKEKPLLGLSTDSRCKAWNTRFSGMVAGTRKLSAGKEYTQICLGGRFYPSHRLIWVMVSGSIDETLVIDHINGVGTDNRLVNLRLVSHSENQKNLTLRRANTSGAIGVHWNTEKNKWHARIYVDGVQKFVGYYSSLEDAISARKDRELRLGYHPFHGLASDIKASSI